MFKPEDQLPHINRAIEEGWKFQQTHQQSETIVVKHFRAMVPDLQVFAKYVLCNLLASPAAVPLSTKLASLAQILRGEVASRLLCALDQSGQKGKNAHALGDIDKIVGHIESGLLACADRVSAMHRAMDSISEMHRTMDQVEEASPLDQTWLDDGRDRGPELAPAANYHVVPLSEFDLADD